jgi:hypothetical protein
MEIGAPQEHDCSRVGVIYNSDHPSVHYLMVRQAIVIEHVRVAICRMHPMNGKTDLWHGERISGAGMLTTGKKQPYTRPRHECMNEGMSI